MIKHIFINNENVNEESVYEILIENPTYKNLKEESKGKFEGNGDGFNCYYFINDYIVCIFNLKGTIVARVEVNPVENTIGLTLAKEFARVAEIISS
ncbi:hypothetical protein [Flavobacterium sp. UBA6031]|uniref:hypothetical protein n=1 Tax=Flavobacterium sp. UBA6031 TaxID=1946551 RepID=UPI0025C0ED10|nr:hypothetical protein [Flavobacterium sp. UBA6031]